MTRRETLALDLALAARDALAAEVSALRARVAVLEAERDMLETVAEVWHQATLAARAEADCA